MGTLVVTGLMEASTCPDIKTVLDSLHAAARVSRRKAWARTIQAELFGHF